MAALGTPLAPLVPLYYDTIIITVVVVVSVGTWSCLFSLFRSTVTETNRLCTVGKFEQAHPLNSLAEREGGRGGGSYNISSG